jgi:hypothetical protein
MRILEVTQLKPIQLAPDGFVFPLSRQTKIILDKKSPAPKKLHELTFQQGAYFGEVGDCCSYLSNDELFELEEKGMLRIRKTK